MPFPVDWTSLTLDDSRARTKSLYDRKGDVFFIIHHAYNYNVFQTIDTFNSRVRTVSANFAVGPKVSGSTEAYCVRTVPERLRAFTTASSYDDKALTVEVSNVNLNHPYPVAQAAKRKLAEVAAYMHREYGMPLNRWHVTSHQEIYKRGWGSYATACPGGDLQGALDWIVAEAKRIVAGAPTEQETEVIHYHYEDERGPRLIEPGAATQLKDSRGFDANITRAIGDYSITTHVEAEGLPGDEVEITLIWYPNGIANGNPSPHYTSRHVIGTNVEDEGAPRARGLVKAHPEFKRAVTSGNAVVLRVSAPSTNRAAVRVTRIDSDAYAFNVKG